MKLQSIIKQALYEESDNALKIFYYTDIFMRRTDAQKEAEQEEPTEEPAEEPEEAPEEEQEESTSLRNSLLTEETFRTKTEGIIEVESADAKTILTLDDLLAYLNRQTSESGKEIINDLVIEIIHALSDPNMAGELENIVYESDKINAIIDYGFSEEDSIGLQLNKNSGVSEASLVLRQNSASSAGSFNPSMFKQKITNVFLPELNNK